MKKLLLLIALILCSFVQAQDYAVINQLNSTDFEGSLKIANDMKAMSKNKYRLYKYKEFEKEQFLKIVYAPEDITDEQLNTSKDFSSCLIVFYKIYYEGKNTDLVMAGVKKYKFTLLQGKYLDVFTVWQSWFSPDANLEKTEAKKYDELRDYDKKTEFYIQKNGNEWSIRNDS